MRVVMDLGSNSTRLAAWREGQPLDNPSISVRLPGLDDFVSPGDADGWSREEFQRYITFLNREFLLPSRLAVSAVAAALPGIPGLALRRSLLEAIEAVLGLEEAVVVPRCLAMAAGWQLRHQQSLGDLMVLNGLNKEMEVAFLSTCPGVTLTLEGLCAGDNRVIRDKAAQLGFLDASGWNFDRLYLLGDVDAHTDLGQWLSNLPQRVSVHHDHDPALAVTEGLLAQITPPLPGESLSMLYPFDFYLAYCDREGQPVSFHTLPFDTTNLELDCNARYRLASLSMADDPTSPAHPERINLQVFESERRSEPGPFILAEGEPVLKIECSPTDLPERMDLILDMGAALILPQLPSSTTEEDGVIPEAFWQHYASGLARLSSSTILGAYFTTNQTASANSSAVTPLEGQIALILTRLHTLLEQWNRD